MGYDYCKPGSGTFPTPEKPGRAKALISLSAAAGYRPEGAKNKIGFIIFQGLALITGTSFHKRREKFFISSLKLKY